MKKPILPILVVVVLIVFMGVVGIAIAKQQKITICHMPRMNQAYPEEPITRKTLHVPYPALDAHLDHGDTLGPCSESYSTPTPANLPPTASPTSSYPTPTSSYPTPTPTPHTYP